MYSAVVREHLYRKLAEGEVTLLSATPEGEVRIEKFWRSVEFDEYVRNAIADVLRAILEEKSLEHR